MTDAPQPEMIHPNELLGRAENYARRVHIESPMGYLAIRLCMINDIDPFTSHRIGLPNWQFEIYRAIIRDTIIQLAKDQVID